METKTYYAVMYTRKIDIIKQWYHYKTFDDISKTWECFNKFLSRPETYENVKIDVKILRVPNNTNGGKNNG